MKHTIPTYRIISLGLAFTGSLFAANLAVAEQDTEEIIIRAPVERTHLVNRPGSGPNVEIIELNRRVNYDDLDLAKPADVIALNSRIDDIAKTSCQKLSDMFPLDRSDRMELSRCTRNAIASAEMQTTEAILAAN